ncbi:hypothetical protein F1559_000557 [Cyanidiococcus yangmingshanensis]|uniref:Uncharacterized protein n=1 Tax=Cyanidiococcus yangmingshanensis TaxID=2690220 RepID=A0A7J7IDJ3_9RHOD|nr:hypothetical protein F1559_000557 [Cyanidiococcus yangmingshanensis]
MNFSAEQILAFHTCGVGVPAAPTEIEATAVQALATRKKLEQESLVFLEGERIRRQARIDALEKGLEQPDQNEPEFGSGGDANSAAESSMRNMDQECEIAVESPNAVSPLHEPAEYQARTVAGKVVALERDSTPIVPNTLGVNHEGATENNTMEMAGSSNRHALSDDDFLALRTADGHLVRTSNGPTVQGVWASRATISPVRNGAPEAQSMLASRAPGTSWSKIFPDQRHSASASTEIPQLKSTGDTRSCRGKRARTVQSIADALKRSKLGFWFKWRKQGDDSLSSR